MSDRKSKRDPGGVNVSRAMVCLVLGYAVLAVLFYWLAGEQLHFRPSRGAIELPAAEAASVEMCRDTVVEQTFRTKIQRLESVCVQWGTYGRQNAGTAVMELYDTRDGSLLMSQSVDMAALSEGDVIAMTVDEPIESVYDTPLVLRIWGDAEPGAGATPVLSFSAVENSSLAVNGEPMEGMLCFSADGEDHVWTGLHYWQIAGVCGAALLLFAALVWFRSKRGKHSYVVNALAAVKKYRFLIRQLVSRDFKTKYKRSVLGIFWSFLNPLMTMAVQYVVFSNLFRFDIENYPVYLITGVVLFNFFSESSNLALTSIIGNAGLITKVYVPKYVYPLTRVLSSLINLLISLIPLMLVALFSGIVPTKSFLLLPYALVCIAVFCLGIGLLLSAAMVFFRDVQFLWGVLTMIWMYLTPIFYPAGILPERVAWVLDVNPLNYYISFARTCVMSGVSPEPVAYIQCFLSALGMLLVGALVFNKCQDKFVLYL